MAGINTLAVTIDKSLVLIEFWPALLSETDAASDVILSLQYK